MTPEDSSVPKGGHAAFVPPNAGIDAARSSTNWNMLSSINQQVRGTATTERRDHMRGPETVQQREATQRSAQKIFCNSSLTFVRIGTRSLLLVPVQMVVMQLVDLSTRCDYQGLQLGDARNKCCWIVHDLVHVGNDRTTSLSDWSTLSLRPRESIVSLEAKAGDFTFCTKEHRLANLLHTFVRTEGASR